VIITSIKQAIVASIIAAAILLTWLYVAVANDQSLFAVQRSSLLLPIGAANGTLFATNEWWRLLTSQFLHVHFPHMLFNCLCIAAVGGHIENLRGHAAMTAIYFAGGTIGQFASVFVYPELVSSGASQALMALCGGSLLLRSKRLRGIALAILCIQVGLDLFSASTIKAGHAAGFLAGMLVGAFIFKRQSSQQQVSSRT
jgi:rhomboid protease GluP